MTLSDVQEAALSSKLPMKTLQVVSTTIQVAQEK